MDLIIEKQECSQTELLNLANCLRNGKHVPVTDSITGEICCGVCGTVIESNIFVVSDPKTDGGFINSQHQVVNYRMGDKALGSMINKQGSVGRKLNDSSRFVKSSKNNTKVLLEFSKASDKLNLPDHVIEEATKSFIELRGKGFLKGRDVHAVVGAFCYLYSKKNSLNLTIKNVCKLLGINQKVLYSYYVSVSDKLEYDSSSLNLNLPEDYMAQLFSNLSLDLKIRNVCIKVVRKIQDNNMHVGKNPTAIASAAIYIGCKKSGYWIAQDKIASIADVSIVTVRNILKIYETKFKEWV